MSELIKVRVDENELDLFLLDHCGGCGSQLKNGKCSQCEDDETK
jgi:hypothetical protein